MFRRTSVHGKGAHLYVICAEWTLQPVAPGIVAIVGVLLLVNETDGVTTSRTFHREVQDQSRSNVQRLISGEIPIHRGLLEVQRFASFQTCLSDFFREQSLQLMETGTARSYFCHRLAHLKGPVSSAAL